MQVEKDRGGKKDAVADAIDGRRGRLEPCAVLPNI